MATGNNTKRKRPMTIFGLPACMQHLLHVLYAAGTLYLSWHSDLFCFVANFDLSFVVIINGKLLLLLLLCLLRINNITHYHAINEFFASFSSTLHKACWNLIASHSVSLSFYCWIFCNFFIYYAIEIKG